MIQPKTDVSKKYAAAVRSAASTSTESSNPQLQVQDDDRAAPEHVSKRARGQSQGGVGSLPRFLEISLTLLPVSQRQIVAACIFANGKHLNGSDEVDAWDLSPANLWSKRGCVSPAFGTITA